MEIPQTQQTGVTQAAQAKSGADQPLDLINVPGALLKVQTLATIAGLSEPMLYRAARRGDLVLTKLGTRCTRITSENARAYLQRLAGAAA